MCLPLPRCTLRTGLVSVLFCTSVFSWQCVWPLKPFTYRDASEHHLPCMCFMTACVAVALFVGTIHGWCFDVSGLACLGRANFSSANPDESCQP
mmetsp:Transcript_65302/g.211519  ORF Transcript_65302/g.211519 Transcript_65302/m.211519 type:complete len:94 (+) Transcript_65302:896-1177(+)